MKLYGKETNQPTNPTSFSFFFFGVIRGPHPAISREEKMGAGFPSVAGGGEGGMHRRTFFSFRFVNLWRKEQGKGGKE